MKIALLLIVIALLPSASFAANKDSVAGKGLLAVIQKENDKKTEVKKADVKKIEHRHAAAQRKPAVLASAGFVPAAPPAPKPAAVAVKEAPKEAAPEAAPAPKIDLANLEEVEIPSEQEVAMTCTTAFTHCMAAGSAFKAQCLLVQKECLSPTP